MTDTPTAERDVADTLRMLADADFREMAIDISVMGLTVEPVDLHHWADVMDAGADEITRLRAELDAARSAHVAEGWQLRELLETALELFEMDDECNKPGTDAWAWTYHVREALAAPLPPAPGGTQPATEGMREALENIAFVVGESKPEIMWPWAQETARTALGETGGTDG